MKRRKTTNTLIQAFGPEILETLIDGLVSLLEGQRQFALEFGLSLDRIMPYTTAFTQGLENRQLIQCWLENRAGEGVAPLRRLFAELMDHQLALIAALDGIAIQTMREIMAKCTQPSRLQDRMQIWLTNREILKKVALLETDQQLRYQKLIAPGLVDAYLWTLEKIRQGRLEFSDDSPE